MFKFVFKWWVRKQEILGINRVIYPSEYFLFIIIFPFLMIGFMEYVIELKKYGKD